jgi:Protein of unknown function (DUF998)
MHPDEYSSHMHMPVLSRLTIFAAAAAILALLSLHVQRADLSPATHMISEYAVGAHGWVMTLCFYAFAAASVTLLAALASRVRGAVGWLGLACLLVTAIGLAIGGAFPMDATTNDPAKMSHSGQMHGVGFMLGVPGELLATLLLTLHLRTQPAWRSRPLVPLAAAVWLSVVVMVPLLMRNGAFGIPNRTFMLAYGAWLIAVAPRTAPARV